MRPTEPNPGVILDNYSEIDILAAAMDKVWSSMAEGLDVEVSRQLPDFAGAIELHEKMLPLARQSGDQEPTPYIYLSPVQAAISGLVLSLAVELWDQEDQFSMQQCLQLQVEIGFTLKRSRKLTDNESDKDED